MTPGRPPMPGGVRFSLGLLVLYALFSLYWVVQEGMGGIQILQLLFSVLFLYYLYWGHPLARQWARLCGQFICVMSVLIVCGVAFSQEEVRDDSARTIALVTGSALALLSILFLIGLGRKSSLRYFDLQCPQCLSTKVRPLSLLYNRIGCKSCKKSWGFREHLPDAKVFD